MDMDKADPPRLTRDQEATSARSGSWQELLGREHRTASLVLAGGIAIYAVNTFVTAALLPSTVAEIGGSAYYAWVTTFFMVASVLTSMMVARTLAARGAAHSYVLAFGIFAAGSAAAALAPSMEVLLAARVLQGLGGGLLAGLGYAVIRDALPEHLWTRATGLVSAMWGLGTLIGPAIGGLFAQFHLWRGAFWLLAATAGLLAVMSVRGLPRDSSGADQEPGRLPIPSLIMLVLAAFSFSAAAVVPVGDPTTVAVLAGAAFVAAFIAVDRVARASVLPRFTYRRGNSLKWIYIALGILSAAAMAEIFLPKFGQELASMSPLVAGIFGATVSIGWSFVQLFSAGVDNRRTARRLMFLGPVLMAVGLTVFTASLGLDTSWAPWAWVIGLLIAGAGVGLAFPHLSVAAMRSSDDPVEGAKAAAGVGTAELVANAISSALVGVLVVIGGPASGGAMAMGAGLTALGVVGIGVLVLVLRGDRSR